MLVKIQIAGFQHINPPESESLKGRANSLCFLISITSEPSNKGNLDHIALQQHLSSK